MSNNKKLWETSRNNSVSICYSKNYLLFLFAPIIMTSAVVPSIVRLHSLNRSDRVQSYAELAEVVERVKVALRDKGFQCRPNSALGSLFLKATKLKKQWEAQTDNQDILTLIQADEAVHIAEVVEEVLDDPAAVEAIRRITKSDMNLSLRQASQGKDMLWELDLLSFLRRRKVPVRMEEPPDLVVTLLGSLGDYGLACKKVYSEAGVKKQLKKGCQQLQAMAGAGLVAFNLDDITPARSILRQPTRQATSNFLQALNRNFIERNIFALRQAVMEGQCDGVFLATTVQADVGDLSPQFNRVTEYTLWTVKEVGPAAHIRLDSLRRLIEGLPI